MKKLVMLLSLAPSLAEGGVAGGGGSTGVLGDAAAIGGGTIDPKKCDGYITGLDEFNDEKASRSGGSGFGSPGMILTAVNELVVGEIAVLPGSNLPINIATNEIDPTGSTYITNLDGSLSSICLAQTVDGGGGIIIEAFGGSSGGGPLGITIAPEAQ